MVHEEIKSKLVGLYEEAAESFGMPVLQVRADNLLALVRRLRNDFGFALFLDVTAVDYPQRQPRFELVYHFYSQEQRLRVRLKVAVDPETTRVPTLTEWYGSARFMEREVHEMYGIGFAGNNDLRPILLYEGFEGHPLRKDYPMEREQPLVQYRERGDGHE